MGAPLIANKMSRPAFLIRGSVALYPVREMVRVAYNKCNACGLSELGPFPYSTARWKWSTDARGILCYGIGAVAALPEFCKEAEQLSIQSVELQVEVDADSPKVSAAYRLLLPFQGGTISGCSKALSVAKCKSCGKLVFYLQSPTQQEVERLTHTFEFCAGPRNSLIISNVEGSHLCLVRNWLIASSEFRDLVQRHAASSLTFTEIGVLVD